MKKTGIACILALSALIFSSCTNDETDPEFDTLTPGEETEQLTTS